MNHGVALMYAVSHLLTEVAGCVETAFACLGGVSTVLCFCE